MRNRFYFGVMISVLVVMIAWTSYRMLNAGREEEPHSVSVIVNNSNSDRWISFRQGLEQAAEDYNVDLNIVSTGPLSTAKEEVALINREIDAGAEGIIVQMLSSDECTEEIAEISGKASFVLLETDIYPEGLYTLTGPDNSKIGRAVFDAVKEEFGEGIKGKTIGIISGDQRQLSMKQRLQGLREGLEEEEAQIQWVRSDFTTEEPEGVRYIEAVDVMIALGNDETEQMVDYIQNQKENGGECILFGVGSSEKTVYYLDKGFIQTLIVPNEFSMGYLSLKSVLTQLRYHLAKAEGSEIDYRVVSRDNLYDEENQKALFPIVQ